MDFPGVDYYVKAKNFSGYPLFVSVRDGDTSQLWALYKDLSTMVETSNDPGNANFNRVRLSGITTMERTAVVLGDSVIFVSGQLFVSGQGNELSTTDGTPKRTYSFFDPSNYYDTTYPGRVRSCRTSLLGRGPLRTGQMVFKVRDFWSSNFLFVTDEELRDIGIVGVLPQSTTLTLG
ncbi:hypothetical protein SEMRO_1388_G268480.1 [Seminavis robusta]|uniref:Uncharacterized protein n=1 Tax=Seminavis robusta TaxID=568900 RepID=A0A9N8HUI7_9STRA|nr:hypothetical protein SEMRO_1388_G268480.1 [Seminavis robusta]|eukprot:Sro1388_g268480.1 n/a (177) ;mRNA; r:24287-24817